MTSNQSYFAAFAIASRPPADRLVQTNAGTDGEPLRALLAATDPLVLSATAIRDHVQDNLWMLTPEAFRYFLPAFLHAALMHYRLLGIFVSELVGALTEPSRDDIVQAIDNVNQAPAGMGLTPAAIEMLGKRQLEWYDSGVPLTMYRQRIAHLTATEGSAILAFFIELEKAHGADFPFGELQVAIDRHWKRFQ